MTAPDKQAQPAVAQKEDEPRDPQVEAIAEVLRLVLGDAGFAMGSFWRRRIAQWMIAHNVRVVDAAGGPVLKVCSCCGHRFRASSDIIACCGCCVGKPTHRVVDAAGGREPHKLTAEEADNVEAEMRRIQGDPAFSKEAMRLFMQAPMPCGHAAGNLLTCDTPPFGCVICGEPGRAGSSVASLVEPDGHSSNAVETVDSIKQSSASPRAAAPEDGGRWSAEQLAVAPNEEVLELALQLRHRICNGGEQGEAAEDARREVLRRMNARTAAALECPVRKLAPEILAYLEDLHDAHPSFLFANDYAKQLAAALSAPCSLAGPEPRLAAELRALIPQMREDAECHRSWTSDEAQRDLQPGSPYLDKYTPRDIAGDRAWHERWAAFYTKVADTMERAARALAQPCAAGLPEKGDVRESWRFCPVCGVAIERLTPENRGIRPLPGVPRLLVHAHDRTALCSGAAPGGAQREEP